MVFHRLDVHMPTYLTHWKCAAMYHLPYIPLEALEALDFGISEALHFFKCFQKEKIILGSR